MLIKPHLIKATSVKFLQVLLFVMFALTWSAQAETRHDAQHLEFWLNAVKNSTFVVVQKNAARQLGYMGDQRAKVELEYQGMHNPSHEVRGEALYALGVMGSMESLGLLKRALAQDSHPEAQKNARRAIRILIKRRDYIRGSR